MRKFISSVVLFLVLLAPVGVVADEPWVVLPAGARPAYMGIHGGTMPVSLLVADDGAFLLSFVGLTGNDFLETLRQVATPLDNVPRWESGGGMGSYSLFAGNATTSMPVVSLSPDLLSGIGPRLQPFGLSHEPLSIEGPVARPEIFPTRRLRNFSLTDWLFPRGKNRTQEF